MRYGAGQEVHGEEVIRPGGPTGLMLRPRGAPDLGDGRSPGATRDAVRLQEMNAWNLGR